MQHFELNIDLYGKKNVVTVHNNEGFATAFFINRQQLLTAAHCVSASTGDTDDDCWITLEDGSTEFCKAVLLDRHYDIALLTCKSYVLPDYIKPISLLSTKFRKNVDLQIIGFPLEIGGGSDYFGVSVRTHSEIKDELSDFDTIISRNDHQLFHSYEGFSGSPVLNEFGLAVGLDTDQMNKSLGFLSFHRVAEVLKASKRE